MATLMYSRYNPDHEGKPRLLWGCHFTHKPRCKQYHLPFESQLVEPKIPWEAKFPKSFPLDVPDTFRRPRPPTSAQARRGPGSSCRR
jgi:hypothetical protein